MTYDPKDFVVMPIKATKAMNIAAIEAQVARSNTRSKAVKANDLFKAQYAAAVAARPEHVDPVDYVESFSDHDALVRRLDVALNGSDAAPQASLCDIVAQVERMVRFHGYPLLTRL